MVKHALFYDEPEAISGNMGSVDGLEDGNDADDVGFSARGPSSSLTKNRKKDKTLKWMVILFLSTLLLLIFQLLLGWLARAVSLLADSGHSAADVVSYGFNLWIERMKFAPNLSTSKSEITPEKVARNARVLDMVGSMFSLVVLVSATWFSASEAVMRLQVRSGKESGNIGRALLAYAIVSTAVSIGILVIYRRWHGKATTKDTGPNSAIPAKTSLPDNGMVTKDLQKDPVDFGQDPFVTGMPLFCPPCKDQSTKNFLPQVALDPVVDTPTGNPSKSEDVVQQLHMIIHPGCTCSSDVVDYWGTGELDIEGCEEAEDVKSSLQKTGVVAIQKNLNLIATILHLITDLLRSVTILVVALLIQMGAIQDAEYGDAVCALVVACMILLGSIALLLQVFARLHACFKRHRSSVQSKITKSNAQTELQAEPCQDEERI